MTVGLDVLSRNDGLRQGRPALVGGWRCYVVVGAMLLWCVGSCGSGLEEALSGIRLLPDPDTISADVRERCTAILTEDEILSSTLAARIDQANGITKQQELATALQSCAIDSLLGGAEITECNACKRAILDQVFGE